MIRIVNPGIAGVVLCGGRSSRMGTPKAWLSVGGEPLLQKQVIMLQSLTSPVMVAAAVGQALPELPTGVATVLDAEPNRGPLAGIAAALEHLKHNGMVEAAFILACDMPGLSTQVVQQMISDWDRSSDAVVPRWHDVPQPLAAIYRVSILPIVLRQLSESQLSMRELLSKLCVQWLEGLPPLAFRNLNTPSDYHTYEPQ